MGRLLLTFSYGQAVIPAKAGIHRDVIAKAWMDPRLRGYDNEARMTMVQE